MAPQKAPVAVDHGASQHSLSISTGVQFMGEKQALVTIYGGEDLNDDTLKGIAEASIRSHFGTTGTVSPYLWDATGVWQDINPTSTARYVQLVVRTKPTARR